MSLTNASHKEQLRAAGWHSRGYLPHFDGRAIPQFSFGWKSISTDIFEMLTTSATQLITLRTIR